MLAIFFSWIIISFILFSMGSVLIKLYNYFLNRDEQYNFLEISFLGLMTLSIPLSIWSLKFPSNHCFLLLCFVLSVMYIVYDRRKLLGFIIDLKGNIVGLPFKIIGPIVLFFIIFLMSSSWLEGIGDALYYHHQNIRWNEEYAVVPGLGNLDDKFAFNSQYLLLSAIFTFRFLFGEALYPLIPLLVIYIMGWLFIELFNSKVERKRVIVFISFLVFILLSINTFFGTSTDLLPNLLAFYIIAKIIFYPDILNKNKILFFVLPLFMILCK
ncbi:hypothetical protein JGH11_19675, partial [Dysgonomonas sp. Marseille-P4677]|uniref:LIC_10190 family membrane protein n=1 Tax=Dysgonomonas sp. Marseille-P4677 TaxID=2364790 RepID=UPI0019116288